MKVMYKGKVYRLPAHLDNSFEFSRKNFPQTKVCIFPENEEEDIPLQVTYGDLKPVNERRDLW